MRWRAVPIIRWKKQRNVELICFLRARNMTIWPGIMQLTEQHVIKRNDPRFAVIDAAAFASKNLYNAANYEIRQAFIHQGVYYSYEAMDKRMKQHEAYKALPAKVSQQVLKQLHE